MSCHLVIVADAKADLTYLRSYAFALFGVSKPRFLPAAARYLPIVLCAVFPRYARKNRTQLKESTALPKAQHANCVSSNIYLKGAIQCRLHSPMVAAG